MYQITFLPENRTVTVAGGTVLEAQISAGLQPNAPCGGNGTCGKCKVWTEGREVLACQTIVDRDMTVTLPGREAAQILTDSAPLLTAADGTDAYALAVDVGTTSLVAYLLDGRTGALLGQESCLNPQRQYGADVISRIEEALQGGAGALSGCVLEALGELTAALAKKAGIAATDITAAALVGNTAMHHLLLGIDPRPLVTPPYMPRVREALEAEGLLPVSGRLRFLPNIAGFVGGDTVGCMLSTDFDRLTELTLLIDIGTNGEMVLGNQHRRIACSTAAGPAFEGAKISCGMRGAAGAVDHVWLEQGQVRYHVLGETAPQGLCGSGLLDLTAVLLELGLLDESGYLEGKAYTLCDRVTLTQRDVREVQLAKAAIRAGIELLAQTLGVSVGDIRRVYLAGAFGNYLNPASACAIGMIPPQLQEKIEPIGNAAGAGARLCALSKQQYQRSKTLAAGTEFLELAGLSQFQDRYVDALLFSEEEL